MLTSEFLGVSQTYQYTINPSRLIKECINYARMIKDDYYYPTDRISSSKLIWQKCN